jgi:hypothetical protein
VATVPCCPATRFSALLVVDVEKGPGWRRWRRQEGEGEGWWPLGFGEA